MLFVAVCCMSLTLITATTYNVVGKRANARKPLAIKSTLTYNYNPSFCIGDFLVIRSQNNTNASDPFAVGKSVISFSRRLSAPFVFSAINESSVILRPRGASENYGVEDPRLTYDNQSDTHFMLYSAVEDNGTNVISRLALATATTNRVAYESGWVRHGAVFPQLAWSKSGAMLIRDSPPHYLFFGDSSIVDGLQWATSRNLYNWTLQSTMFMQTRPQEFDSGLIEAGPRPVRLSTGDYLLIYNSARHGYPSAKPGYDFQYNVAWAILNGSDPSQVLQRASVPLFSPKYDFELGDPPAKVCVPNVVFAEGIEQIGVDLFRIYYGAADAVIGAFDVFVY